MNALKHGLTSREIVIFDEDPLEFESLRAALEEAYSPLDAVDRELVDQHAGLFWRSRRIPKQEAALLGSRPEDALIYLFQSTDPNARKSVLERLRKLQQARRQGEGGEIGFYADLAQALRCEMPEVFARVIEAEKDWDTDKLWAALTRYETSLRNGISRTLALLPARRAAQFTQR